MGADDCILDALRVASTHPRGTVVAFRIGASFFFGCMAGCGDLNPAMICPITQDIMVHPVTTADGHTYERDAIRTWFALNTMSPLTGLNLADTTLKRNRGVRKVVRRFFRTGRGRRYKAALLGPARRRCVCSSLRPSPGCLEATRAGLSRLIPMWSWLCVFFGLTVPFVANATKEAVVLSAILGLLGPCTTMEGAISLVLGVMTFEISMYVVYAINCMRDDDCDQLWTAGCRVTIIASAWATVCIALYGLEVLVARRMGVALL